MLGAALVALIALAGWWLSPKSPEASPSPSSQRDFTVGGLSLSENSDAVRDRYGSFSQATSQHEAWPSWVLTGYGGTEKIIFTGQEGSDVYLVSVVVGPRLEENGRLILKAGDNLKLARQVLGDPETSTRRQPPKRPHDGWHYRTRSGKLTLWLNQDVINMIALSKEIQ